MTIQYYDIVPWGRSFQEDVYMFDLTDKDLSRSIIGCGDGPASYNFEMTRQEMSVVSVDPVYNLDRETIQKRINETYSEVLEQTRENLDKFVWGEYSFG